MIISFSIFLIQDICLASVAVDCMGRIVDVWNVKKSIFFPVYENMGVSTEDMTKMKKRF